MKYFVSIGFNIEKNSVIPEIVEVKEDTSAQLHELVKADVLDCQEVEINGKMYDAWVDDNGLYSGKPFISWAEFVEGLAEPSQLFVGEMVLAKVDDDGGTIGMSLAEAAILQEDYVAHMKSISDKLFEFIRSCREEN